MSKAEEMSLNQLHQISRSAKISSALISLFLSDLDGDQEFSDSAKEWLSSQHDGPASVLNCSRHLANLNAYLHNFGLDVAPMGSEHSWRVSPTKDIFVGEDHHLPATSSEWLAAIEKWSSPEVSAQERTALAQQLVEVVDHQVQACYAHAREISQGVNFQMRRDSDIVNDAPSEPLLLTPGQGPM